MASELMTREEVAKLLKISVRRFDEWRAAGQAPRAIKMPGRPRWRKQDVERWIATRLSRT